MASIEQSTELIKKKIKEIEGKLNDPSFYEKLSNYGHDIASDFLESVRIDLNYIGIEAGRDSPNYLELCEAVAIIGSGCLRWATAKTRTLISASDFRKNSPLFNSEKIKVEKCHELITVFSKMVKQDSSAAPVIIEVNNIVDGLHSCFQKKSRWF